MRKFFLIAFFPLLFIWGCDSTVKSGNYTLVFSPDGTHAVFSFKDPVLFYECAVVVDRGSGLLKTVAMLPKVGKVAWSPDGKEIAYINQKEGMDSGLRIFNLAAKKSRPACVKPYDIIGDLYLSWSPSGKYVLCETENSKMLVAVDVEEGKIVNVAPLSETTYSTREDFHRSIDKVQWSLKDDKVATIHTSNRTSKKGSGKNAIDVIVDGIFAKKDPYFPIEAWVKNLETGEMECWGTMDYSDPGDVYFDGERIRVSFYDKIVDFSKGRESEVVMNFRTYDSGMFSPDGRWLLVNKSGSWSLVGKDGDWLLDLKDGRQFYLSDLLIRNGIKKMKKPQWSSDGAEIVFSCDDSIYLFNLKSYDVRRINHREGGRDGRGFFVSKDVVLCLYDMPKGHDGYYVNTRNERSTPLDAYDKELKLFFSSE